MPAFAPALRLDGAAGAGVEVDVGKLDEVEVLGEEGLVLGRAEVSFGLRLL
jgi:hypothetical protein